METGLFFILIICVACLFEDDEHGYEKWWGNWKAAWKKRADAKRAKLEGK